MTLLHPVLLVWGLLAIPLVLLAVVYRRERHMVSSGALWDAVLAERTWPQRARRAIRLALRVAALELLVIAAADPQLKLTAAGNLVLVVDVSASMQAADAGGSRFDRARSLARQTIDNMPADRQVALLCAGSVNRVACGLTGDRQCLRAALDAIEPTDGVADLAAAVALAEDLIPRQRGRIVVFSDHDAGDHGASGRAIDVEWIVCGGPVDNVGITRCEVRPLPSNPAEMEWLVEVLNAGTQPVSCPLEIDYRGSPAARQTLELGPGETLRKIQSIRDPSGGLLVARLKHADALVADNVAAVQVPERRRTRVTLITPGNRAVEAALGSLPGIDVTVSNDASLAANPADLFIWDGTLPARVPAGPNLVLAPATSCELWTLGTVAAGSAVVLDEIASPPVAHVDFTLAVLEDPVRLDFKLPARTLVRSLAGDPIYSLLERATGDVLVLHVRIEKTDLAARGMLPLLFADALRSFGVGAARYEPAVTTAELVSIGPLDQPRRLLPPNFARDSGNNRTAPRLNVEPRQGIVGPLDRVGLWQVVPLRAAAKQEQVTADAAPTIIASQLADRGESDLKPGGASRTLPVGSALEPAGAAGRTWLVWLDGGLWPGFVLGALLLLGAECMPGRWPSGGC